MIQNKVDSNLSFSWQSQLRHRWDDAESDCFANICDAGLLNIFASSMIFDLVC